MSDMLPQGYDDTAHFWDEGEVPAVSGTVEVGEITTVTKEPGEDADVAINNVGSDTAAKLNFTFGIPKGDTGERGSQGPVGPQGQEGPQGERGPAGPQGEKGEKGDKGDTGETGPQGPQGIQGPKGDTGDTGAQGPQGIQGETGPQGPVGPAGPQGPAGADGTDGTDGVTPVISATATVGTGTSNPSCTVTKTGTDEAPSFDFAFDGIKGIDGQGSELTNNDYLGYTNFSLSLSSNHAYNNNFTLSWTSPILDNGKFLELLFKVNYASTPSGNYTTLQHRVYIPLSQSLWYAILSRAFFTIPFWVSSTVYGLLTISVNAVTDHSITFTVYATSFSASSGTVSGRITGYLLS